MTIPKRPRGKPPLPPGEGERERLEIRLSKDRRSRYEAAAVRAGEALSAWVKRVLDRASRR